MAAPQLRLNFTNLTTSQWEGGSLIVDRLGTNVAKVFNKIEKLAAAPGGFAMLDDAGLVPAENLPSTVTPATLHVSVTAAANTAVTATLPAVGGKFHLITAIQLVRAATAAVAGGALLVTTSTNLPGNPSWTAGNAIAAGQSIVDLDYQPANPLQSLAPGVATTIVMPAAGANAVNRINVSYALL